MRLATTRATAERMEERVTRLIGDFASYLDAFHSESLFTGPSLHFYLKSLATRAAHASALEALDDDRLFEYVYATLTAWGMHRVGPRGAKLVDLPDMIESFRAQAPRIARIQDQALGVLAEATLPNVTDKLWEIINNLRVGIGQAKLVANSKALHMLLPRLVPPIDREYTLHFFYAHKTISRGDERVFREVFPHFRRIAQSSAEEIEHRVRIHYGMDACETKVIDNAIVGFVRRHHRARPRY